MNNTRVSARGLWFLPISWGARSSQCVATRCRTVPKLWGWWSMLTDHPHLHDLVCRSTCSVEIDFLLRMPNADLKVSITWLEAAVNHLIELSEIEILRLKSLYTALLQMSYAHLVHWPQHPQVLVILTHAWTVRRFVNGYDECHADWQPACPGMPLGPWRIKLPERKTTGKTL